MNKEKNKVIVTGGAGFIGGNLAKELVEQGYEVHIIDNLSGGKRERVPEGATLHVADITDITAIEPLFADAHYVFHMAALPRVQYSIEQPKVTNEANVEGMLNVLIAAKKAGVKKVVYSASSSAYGDQPTMPLEEGMSAMPKSPYGLQKYVGELYMRLWSEVYGVPTVSLRYFNVYGPGLDPDGAYALVIGKFLKQRSLGEPITITGDGKQTRDFTHVRDVVRANILAAESATVGKGEVINIGAGREISINELATMIGGPVAYVPARLEPSRTLADNSLAKKLLGWSPEVKFEDGIAELKGIFGLTS